MKRMVAILLALLLTLGTPCVALAAAKDGITIDPMYKYTRKVVAMLNKVDGKALCYGSIRVNSSSSSISAVTTLYKKSGTTWVIVATWSDSTSGSTTLIIDKTRPVSAGTYKVVLRGTITASDGATESVKETSDNVVFP